MNFSLPKGSRVAVAMSGGVDSSVVAALAVEAGFDVVGITLKLYEHDVVKKGTCCAGIDIYDAKKVCDTLNIPHFVLDYESRFKEEVIDQFADSYVRGETPVPCILCNKTVKFSDLFKTAKDLKADALLTGHYVIRKEINGRPELHKAFDPKRDQSYFLFTITNEQLNFLRFPLGHLENKNQTREIAKKWNLQVSNKPDSQDICFIPNGDYASVVSRLRPESLIPGPILLEDGTVLGTHDGIINFTVGQKKGIGKYLTDFNKNNYYVISIDPNKNAIVVGPRSSLATIKIKVKEINWLMDTQEENLDEIDITVKIRSYQNPIPAKIEKHDETNATITLLEPEFGVSKGQACVFYNETRILGGGWIC